METEEAVAEFVTMLRLGTAALRAIIAKDAELGPDLEADITQLFYIADSLDEVGDNIRSKTESKRRGTSTL